MISLALLFVVHQLLVVEAVVCPNRVDCGRQQCCVQTNSEYYCCGDEGIYYTTGYPSWWRDHWSVAIGLLIAGIIISIIISVLLCLFCNGCWLYRCRRGGGSSVAHYPPGHINDFPVAAATVYFHPFPPVYAQPPPPRPAIKPYNDLSPSSNSDYSSTNGSKLRSTVRFDENGHPIHETKKSILKS